MKYKIFGTHTGLPASELILGAASFGQRRAGGAEVDEIQKILAAYANAGGNFIDVSDQYQLGESEETVGKFLAQQRHNFIICTKYSRSSENNPSHANSGNHRKAMIQAVEGSLKRLKTDYIDIYMPHYDDGVTPAEEVARGLEDLIKSGKVLYAGLANFPAWKAASIATATRLAAIQVEYNLVQRTAERELIPMANNFGLGIMFYSPLAGGLLTGKYRKGSTGRLKASSTEIYQEDPATKSIINELELIAKNMEATPGQVALAWALTKNAFSIIGARTHAHLEDSFKAAAIKLNPEQDTRLENASAITMGFPHDLLKTVQRSF